VAPRRPRNKAAEAETNALLHAYSAAELAALSQTLREATAIISAPFQAQVREATAVLRALAERPVEYALVLRTPEYALLGRNTEQALLNAPKAHEWQLTLEQSVDGIPAHGLVRSDSALSAEARRLLAIICGGWADLTQSPSCALNKHAQDGTCKHHSRAVPMTYRQLARDNYGSAGGREVERVKTALSELQSVRLTYGLRRTAADGTTQTITGDPAPPLRIARAGVGIGTDDSLDNQILNAELSADLHAELLRGEHTLVRRELLTGWREEWKLELVLRLYAHPALWYGSNAMRRGATGRDTQISIGRTAALELGNLRELLPSLVHSPTALRRRLDAFADELRARSRPYERQILGIREKRTGRHIEGWILGVGYPVQPLTGAQQRKYLPAGGIGRRGKLPPEPPDPETRRSVEAYRRVLPSQERVLPLQLPRVAVAPSEIRNSPRDLLETYERPIQLDNTEQDESRLASEGRLIARYRREWRTLSDGERRALRARYPAELADLP